MKWIRIDRGGAPVWAELRGDMVFTLTQAPFETVSYDGGQYKLEECTLLAPCEPTKIVCVGKNYYDHALELDSTPPDHPILFLKGINTLNHPNGTIAAPDFVTRLDYEGELAFVVKKRAKHVKAQDYAQYILGYTCLNDVTARDIQSLDGQWTRAKTMDGFAPVGPWVVDDIDASNLNIETRLNGKPVQTGNTSQFMTKLPELFAFITAAMTLEAGDVVTTGTPAGIGPMVTGDIVEVEIEKIGVLQNIVG